VDVQTDYRAAVVDLLTDYAASVSLTLQIYRARPRSINPPTAFIDSMAETLEATGPMGGTRILYQRTPTVEVVVVHGRFDDGVAVDQRDVFCDGFVEFAANNFHVAGANTEIQVTRIEDDPTFVPDWLPEDVRRTYYGTRITLEGYVGDN